MLCVVGAMVLGYTLQISNGTLHPDAFVGACCVAGLLLAVLFVPERELSPLVRAGSLALIAGGLAWFASIHLTTPPGMYLRGPPDLMIEHHRLIAIAAVCGGLVVARPPGVVVLVVILGTWFVLGLWLLKASPEPYIDVWHWHRTSYEALKQGIDPYGINMPNIYGHTQWFAPGLADNTTVFVGYPYPPVTMLLGFLGHLAKADYRYFNLVAQTATGAMIALTGRGRLGAIAAMVYLFTPRGLFVLEQGWTESLSALGVAATLFAAVRFPRALPWVFGVMLGIKQYFIFALPLMPFLLTGEWKGRWKGFLVRAAIIPAVVTLPFFFWNPGGFINSVVVFQSKQPFRTDALSVLAWLVSKGGPQLWANTSFIAAGVTLGLGWWKAPRNPAGFAAVLSAAIFFFFFFAKQAFTNYYYLVIACLCVSAAAFVSGLSVNDASLSDGGPSSSAPTRAGSAKPT